MPFLDPDALARLGFRQLGRQVSISDRASLIHPERMSIGDQARIDDFCVLSAGTGGIAIGRHVHIGCMCSLLGQEAILLEDFSGLSSRVAIYSSSDDYSGRTMTNPTVPAAFTGVQHGAVRLGRHAIIGAGSVVLPGVTIGEGAAVGALSLVLRDCAPFTTYHGNPAVRIGPRSRRVLELEREFLARGEPS
jgi:acetyltransferase-like isoleucine patch superfamily enzyme